MLLLSSLVAAAMACSGLHSDGKSLLNEPVLALKEQMDASEEWATIQGVIDKGTYMQVRSSSDETLSNKWQREKNLKQEMMAGITHCLTTRNRPMEKSKQRALEKTDWFTAWDTHCSNQIDLNCPIKAGECWAMGVITCRKNCDAKFLLRGNRGKFKRCIYKQMKTYEKDNTGVVSEQCSVFSNTSLQ